MATEVEKAITALTDEVSGLKTACEVSNSRWDEQARVNQVVLKKLDEDRRALFGFNDHEGVVGKQKTHEKESAGKFLAHAQRLKTLEKFEARVQKLKWLAITVVLTGVGTIASAGVLIVLGWK